MEGYSRMHLCLHAMHIDIFVIRPVYEKIVVGLSRKMCLLISCATLLVDSQCFCDYATDKKNQNVAYIKSIQTKQKVTAGPAFFIHFVCICRYLM